jgi:hypothetical protein
MATRETPTHSPAPWDIGWDGHIRDANGVPIMSTHRTRAEDDRLIRKAPDLLAACRRYVLRCGAGEVAEPPREFMSMKALVDYIDGEGE